MRERFRLVPGTSIVLSEDGGRIVLIPELDTPRIIERVTDRMTVVDLAKFDYEAAILRCADRDATSGAIYDALHLVAAERTDAVVFLTFNVRHFVPLLREGGPQILAPPDPPSLLV